MFLKPILTRLKQGHRTMKFPAQEPLLPDRFRGLPAWDASKCAKGTGCDACVRQCPTSALSLADGVLSADLGRCLFCADCVTGCPSSAIEFSQDYRLATRERQELNLALSEPELKHAEALGEELRKLFGRSLRLRQVSAGGCNACEADSNVLTTIGWDIGRFGIQFVASPRHADGLLVTGPVSRNMSLALKKTYDAVAEPKIVIAVGACAISGGPFIGHDEVSGGASAVVPVDLYIPGCPPHPVTILDGLLRLLGRRDR